MAQRTGRLSGEIRVSAGNVLEAAGKQPGPNSLREGKYCCIRSFKDGEGRAFDAGLTYVTADHEVLSTNPEAFALYGSKAADTAIRSNTGSSRRRQRQQTKKSASAKPAPTEVRSQATPPPWKLRDAAPSVPQIRRPGVARGDAIYDLSTIRFSVIDETAGARELRDRAMRAIERARFPHGRANSDEIRDHLAEIVDAADDKRGSFCRRLLVTGSPRHRELFARAACGGYLTDDEKRALSLDGPSGGYAVPFTLDPTIVPTSSGAINPLRAISRTETTLTDAWKGVTSDGPSASYRAEGAESDAGDLKLGQPELKMEKADWWTPAAYEIGQDWSGLEPALAAILQRSKDELEADKFLSGDGEDEPFGLLTDATEVEETASKGVFVAKDLDALEEALPPGFLERAQYLGNRSIFKRVRNFSAEGGAPIWVKVPGQRPEINGVLANELSTMAGTVEGGESILVLGDFDYFLIADRIGVSVIFTQQFGDNQRPTAEMGVYAMWRNGSKVLSKKAFRVLKVKS